MKDLPQKSGHINAIDGLRGVAAFAVLAHHSRNAILDFHFGYLAVDFFFVLSGYVIGLAYEQRLERGLRVSDYIIIRLERLYPMLLIGALFGLIAVQVTPADGYFIPKESYGLSIAFLAQVLLIPFVISQGAFFINVPQWSIVFEILVNIFHAVFRRQLSNMVLIFILGLSAAALVRIGITHDNINYGWGQIISFWGFRRFCLVSSQACSSSVLKGVGQTGYPLFHSGCFALSFSCYLAFRSGA